MKKQCRKLASFAAALESVYGPWGTVHAFSQTPFDTWVQDAIDGRIQEFINVRVTRYLDIFDAPTRLMEKRSNNKKMLQRDEAYEAINAQLEEELPRFLELAAQYFDILLCELAQIQANAYRSLRRAFSDLVDDNGRSKDILQEYHARMQTVHECISSITTLQKKQLDQEERRSRKNHQSESDLFSIGSGGAESNRSSLLLTWEEMLTMTGRSSEGSKFITSRFAKLHTDLQTGKKKDVKRLSMISTATSSSISRPLELIVSSNSTDKQLDPSGGLLFGETKPAFSGIAIQDYESDIPERLQLRQGDVIQILMPTDPENNNSDQDWWYGRLESGGPYGWVPARCCRYYQNVQD